MPFWQVAGDVLYFIASSPEMVLGGRFLSGVGMGGGSVIYAMLAWTSSENDRTSSFSLAIALRNIGIVVGPGLNILLLHIDFHLGPYHIHLNNVAGFLMASLWTFNLLLMPCFYFDPQVRRPDGRNVKKECPDLPRINGKVTCTIPRGSSASSDDEREPLISESSDIQYRYKVKTSDSMQKDVSSLFYAFADQYLRDEIVVLLAIQFVQFFNQCGLESLVPPFAKDTFGWTIFHSSLLFMAASIVTVAVYVILMCIKSRVSDRSIVIIGLLLDICGVALLVAFVPRMKPHHNVGVNTIIFVIGFGLAMTGFPAVLIATAGLLSKLTSMSWQGRTQGVRRVVTNIGMIMGPLWSGSLMDNLYIMLAAMLALLLYVSVLGGLSSKRLYEGGNHFRRNSFFT